VTFPQLGYSGPYLFGTRTFINGDTSIVSLTRDQDETMGIFYFFVLNLFIADPGKIQFKNVVFDPINYAPGSGTSCKFPPELQCSDPSPYLFSGMQCFLNSTRHPAPGYRQMDITFKIFYDIENSLAIGHTLKLDIYSSPMIRTDMYIRIRENRPYSSVWSAKSFRNSLLTRSADGDSWVFDVNETLKFYETYTVPKGAIAAMSPAPSAVTDNALIYTAVSAFTKDLFKLCAEWKRTPRKT